MDFYYDKTGKPISVGNWLKLFRDKEYQVVASETLIDVNISTVWLGLNHAFSPNHIMIFETMVFGGRLNGECQRYATLERAEEGHLIMVEKVLESQILPSYGSNVDVG